MNNIFEYGIWSERTNEIHREGFTEEEALAWIEEWQDDGGLESAFCIVRRPLNNGWEIW